MSHTSLRLDASTTLAKYWNSKGKLVPPLANRLQECWNAAMEKAKAELNLNLPLSKLADFLEEKLAVYFAHEFYVPGHTESFYDTRGNTSQMEAYHAVLGMQLYLISEYCRQVLIQTGVAPQQMLKTV